MKKISFLIDQRIYYIPFIQYILEQVKNKKFILSGFLIKDASFFNCNNVDVNKYNLFKDIKEVFQESDIIFSLGYWKIIPTKYISDFKGKIINLHYSYLLKYEGRYTCTYAIQNNEEYHGVTLHYMTEKLDDGPIVDSRKVDISNDDTAYTLMQRCSNIALAMFKDNFYDIIEGTTTIHLEKDKNPINIKYNSINHRIPDNLIENKSEIYNIVRSLTYRNKPAPYIEINNKKIYLVLNST